MNHKTKVALIAVGAVAVVAALIIGIYFLVWASAEPRGALDAREQTVADGTYRISNFDRFHDLYSDIEDRRIRLSVIYAEPPTNPRDVTTCQGLLASYHTLVQDYNAASRSWRTRGQWRDPNLPELVTPMEGNPCTS